jgi:hypothetical protein
VPPNADPSLPVLLRYHRELDTAGREKLLRTLEEVLDGLDDDRYDSDARLTDENRQSFRMVREHVWVERLRGQLKDWGHPGFSWAKTSQHDLAPGFSC